MISVSIEDHGLSKDGEMWITVVKYKTEKMIIGTDRVLTDRFGLEFRYRNEGKTFNPLGFPIKFKIVEPKRRIRSLPKNRGM